jgi:hypothetical protein
MSHHHPDKRSFQKQNRLKTSQFSHQTGIKCNSLTALLPLSPLTCHRPFLEQSTFPPQGLPLACSLCLECLSLGSWLGCFLTV